MVSFKRKKYLDYTKKMPNFDITGLEKTDGLCVETQMRGSHAAMELCVFYKIKKNHNPKIPIWAAFDRGLKSYRRFQVRNSNGIQKSTYLSLELKSEVRLREFLGILARKNFNPSLDQLTNDQLNCLKVCIKSQNLANRIICLFLHVGITTLKTQSIINSTRSAV